VGRSVPLIGAERKEDIRSSIGFKTRMMLGSTGGKEKKYISPCGGATIGHKQRIKGMIASQGFLPLAYMSIKMKGGRTIVYCGWTVAEKARKLIRPARTA